jgi:PEGA domain
MRTFAATLLALSFVAMAPRAWSADTSQTTQAAELKKKGDELMVALEYRAALDVYEKSYAISADPALLYNRARAHQALSEYPEALDLLEQFTRSAPPDLKARVPKLDELIVDLRARVALVEVKCDAEGARVLVRDTALGTCNGPPIRTRAGAAKIEVRAPGFDPFVQNVELRGGGETNTLTAKLQRALDAGKGWLTITTAPTSSLVVVDGRALGTAPVDVALQAGRHALVVRHEGYDESQLEVTLEDGQRRRLDVSLVPPKPVTQKWWFWTSIGAVVVGGTVLTYALLTTRDAPNGSIAPGQVRGP